MSTAERILITGAAGGIGTLLRPTITRRGRLLRLLDLETPQPMPAAGLEEAVQASVTDLEALTEACAGVDAVIHLGGRSLEGPAEETLLVNGFGTYCVLEAAHRAGVGRVVLASSNHAVGFHQRDEAPAGGVPGDAPARPDTFYGWSKVAVESIGRLYHDRYGMNVICLRIGSWFERPHGLRGLAMWLSPADGARLVEACLSAAAPGYRIVWGISRNTRRWCSLAEGEAIGYFPEDDAETFADDLIAEHGEPDFATDPTLTHVGGAWCTLPLGTRPS